jgi:hypothetical protein
MGALTATLVHPCCGPGLSCQHGMARAGPGMVGGDGLEPPTLSV